ncbi:MAG: glucose-6-phosphate isomerase [Pseudomonadota bacterium]|nr:glucose-6-phosphate isomerase [Pseudomonadota bacterium]
MLYTQSLDHCFASGVKRAEVEAYAAELAPALKSLKARQVASASPLLALPFDTSDLEEIEHLAADIRRRFDHVVVIGSGGSGLSGRALIGLIPPPLAPTFYFLENIDPDVMTSLSARLDMANTCFLVISKSGTTAETLSQFYIWLAHAGKKLDKQAAQERFIVITLPESSPLRRSAESYGLHLMNYAGDIGGRFSILTNVGLLPAAVAGLDIKALRRGAQTVVEQMDKAPAPVDCPPAVGAALQCAFVRKHYPMSVMLPYSDRLAGFAGWYRQCWAESLGKQGKGSTPVPALGATDQHSQLQLYLDGPKDKLFHMITVNRGGTGQHIPAPEDADMAYLQGKTTGDVMQAEQRATLETLVRHHCPVRHLQLESLGEEQMGALLMHFTLEIMFMSFLLNVNPFDQPAVEEGKRLAREHLLAGAL